MELIPDLYIRTLMEFQNISNGYDQMNTKECTTANTHVLVAQLKIRSKINFFLCVLILITTVNQLVKNN
ncbi:hypothetical protein NO098_150007 [Flavobacterium psychrophilum]|nr:hypothetical protein NO098_150007 [Flavobacterium psychrophilum]